MTPEPPSPTPPLSWDSVVVRYLDREAVLRSLREAAQQLVSGEPAARQVLLFGSLATGDYGADSDADVLVVLSQDQRRFLDRIPAFARYFAGVPVDVDVFPYTEEEAQRRLGAGDPFMRRILAEAVSLL